MDEELDGRIPSDLGPDRRTFIKRVVATAAVAAPFIASFDLQDAAAKANIRPAAPVE